jgi:hypothetical protein
MAILAPMRETPLPGTRQSANALPATVELWAGRFTKYAAGQAVQNSNPI